MILLALQLLTVLLCRMSSCSHMQRRVLVLQQYGTVDLLVILGPSKHLFAFRLLSTLGVSCTLVDVL